MIKSKDGTLTVKGALNEICADLEFAITGVFEGIAKQDKDLAKDVVNTVIMEAMKRVKKEHGITLCENLGDSMVVNIHMVNSASADGTTVADIMNELEQHRKNRQGVGADAQPTE